MKVRLVLANISRWIARITALPAVLLVFFSIYAGYAISHSEPSAAGANPWVGLVCSLPLLGASVGLMLAYWNEKIGSIVGFVSFPALFTMIWWAFGGLEDMLEGLSFFAFLLVPIGLFFASWSIRRWSPQLASLEEDSREGKEKIMREREETIKKELVELLAEGLDSLEIADRLQISPVHASLLTTALVDEYGVDNRATLVEHVRNNVEWRIAQSRTNE